MKVFLSILLVLIVIISLVVNVDESAMKLQDEALDRALISFGLAKGLNAVISLLQGTELSFAPAGIGLNFSIGEVLDPFNDMVERFSWIMLFSSVSLGIQKILLLLSAKLFLQVALIVSVILSLILLWVKRLEELKILPYALKIFAFLLLLRFGAIIFVYSSQLLYTSTLQVQYNEASTIVEKTKQELEDLQSQNKIILNSKKSESFIDELTSKYKDALDALNISKQLKSLEDSIEVASKNIITLITIFVIQSIVMPMLFLWIFILSLKQIFHFRFSNDKLTLLV